MTTLQDWLTSLSGGSALLLGLIMGAMMASDLGGPINKAAYLFATAGLSSGATVNQEIMAAVIISGMVPPLAMALATTLRPKLFNENERENGKAAWLLGASFISEGAIPFASADPARVIPSTIVGGAIAGAISMGAHVASPAPARWYLDYWSGAEPADVPGGCCCRYRRFGDAVRGAEVPGCPL